VRDEELDVRRRSGHSEVDRTHKHRPRPETDRHHGPRRPASDLPHTLGKVSLDEILERNPKADRRRASRSAKARLFVTVCHWSMTLLLALNLLSGMRIGWGYEESPFGGLHMGMWSKVLATVSPAGAMFGINLIVLHVWSAFLMLLVAGVYVGYLFKSGTARKLRISRSDLRKLVDGLRHRRFFKSKPALWSTSRTSPSRPCTTARTSTSSSSGRIRTSATSATRCSRPSRAGRCSRPRSRTRTRTAPTKTSCRCTSPRSATAAVPRRATSAPAR